MVGEKCKECVAIYNSGTAWNNDEELWDSPDSARCRCMFRRSVACALDSLHHVVGWSQESIDISRGRVNLP